MPVEIRYHAPYMEWAKKRPSPTFDLAGSNVLACSVDDVEGAREALSFAGHNDNGYAPLVDLRRGMNEALPWYIGFLTAQAAV